MLIHYSSQQIISHISMLILEVEFSPVRIYIIRIRSSGSFSPRSFNIPHQHMVHLREEHVPQGHITNGVNIHVSDIPRQLTEVMAPEVFKSLHMNLIDQADHLLPLILHYSLEDILLLLFNEDTFDLREDLIKN